MMKDAEFYYKIGRENNVLNRYVEAVDDYTRAIRLNPSYRVKTRESQLKIKKGGNK